MTAELVLHLRQASPNIHVILVCCDGDPSLRARFDYDSRITVLEQGNLGYAGGNNLGFRAAMDIGAKWVVVLNSDAFPLGDAFNLLRRALETDPRAAAAGGTLVSLRQAALPEHNWGTAFDWSLGRTSNMYEHTGVSEVDFSCGAMLMFSVAALRKVGGFDSSLFLFYEEIDWAERARELGYKIFAVAEARALHDGSHSARLAGKAVAYYMARNRLIVLRRYSNRHGQQFRVTRQLFWSTRVAAGHLVKGRFGLAWPSLWGAMCGLRAPLLWTDEPHAARQEQRWETLEPTDSRSSLLGTARAFVTGH